MTRRVLASGDIAVATLRTPSALAELTKQYPQDRLLVLPLDVTEPSSIAAALKTVEQQLGRIDVVVSNAGVSVLGEVEGTPDAPARNMFEVNFWGATHVLQEAVRFMREVNPPGVGGRIIQITSGVALCGYPACGFYSASKHGESRSTLGERVGTYSILFIAIEGLTESLAGELDSEWNIHVSRHLSSSSVAHLPSFL